MYISNRFCVLSLDHHTRCNAYEKYIHETHPSIQITRKFREFLEYLVTSRESREILEIFS